MFDRRFLRVDRDQVVLHADLSNSSAGTLDDMIVDTTGRIYVGDLGIDLSRPPGDFSAPAGRILLISNESGATVVAEGLRFPNGIAVSGDGKQLVVAESNGDCLTRYEILGDGSLSLRGRAGGFGEPDGICMDAEGAAWTALYKEDSFIRVDPHGRVTHRIPAPGGRGIACVLGGDSRRTLFCISAETTHQNLMKGRSAARIDASEVEVPGAGFREHFDFPRSRKASPHTPPCPPKPGF